MSYILRVTAAGTEFTYSAEIMDRGLTVGARLSGGTIEITAVNVEIDSAGFLGATSMFTLPGDASAYYRAQLVETTDSPEGGEIVWVDGCIFRQDISVNPVTESWTIRLIGSANDAFMAAMEARDVVSGTTYTIGCEIVLQKPTARAQGLTILEIAAETLIWHDLASMFEATAAAAGPITIEWADPARDGFMLDVEYNTGDPSSPTDTYSRKASLCVTAPFARDDASGDDRPLWDGRALWDVCKKIGGWRLSCRFATYPSANITARIIGNRFDPADGGIDLTGELMGPNEGFTQGFKPSPKKEFAVQWKNAVGEDPLLTLTERPKELAVYAAQNFRIDGDGRGLQADLLELDLHVAHYSEDPPGVVETPTAGYEETVHYATAVVEEGKVWVGECTAGNNFVAYRVPSSPTSNQHTPTGVHFAANIYNQYGMDRAPAYTLSARYRLEELTRLPAVGDPLDCYLFRGILWVAENVQARIARGVVNIDGAMYVEVQGVAFETPDVGEPTDFTAEHVRLGYHPTTEEEQWEVDLSWVAPLVGESKGPADDYELEVRYLDVYGSDMTGWMALTTTASTSYTDGPHLGNFRAEYRIRSRNTYGVSNWVYAKEE